MRFRPPGVFGRAFGTASKGTWRLGGKAIVLGFAAPTHRNASIPPSAEKTQFPLGVAVWTVG